MGVVSMIGYFTETAAVTVQGHSSDNQFALAAVVVRTLTIATSIAGLAAAYLLLIGRNVVDDSGATEVKRLLAILVWAPVLEILGAMHRL
jgi:hypothetical protein